jgi:CubicO group peptidase (beta-lactamase class C family)
VEFPASRFPALTSAIQDGIQRGLHTGVQIYVSLNRTAVLDSALGEATPARPMSAETIMPWRSAGKPLTALLILKHVDNGRLQLSSALQDVLEETRGTDKAHLTLQDLLTHEAGFPNTDTGWPTSEWNQTVDSILRTPREFEVGTAAYHPQSSWFLLGEILRRLNPVNPSESFASVLRRDLLDPLQMPQASCGISAEQLRSHSDQLPVLYERDKGQLVESQLGKVPWLTRESPGGNMRGPIRELGCFYELLLARGRHPDGTSFVTESVIQMMTARHRSSSYDRTLQHVVDFGLGVICDSNQYGISTVPYGFGAFCSPATFGHGGSQCSMGFCDPERALVVAWSANGFCGEGQHQRRNRMINEAVYYDLEFTGEDIAPNLSPL